MFEKFLCVSKVFITVYFKYEIKIKYFTKPNFLLGTYKNFQTIMHDFFFYKVKGRKPLIKVKASY